MNLSSEAVKTFAFAYRNITAVRRNIFQLTEIFYFPFISLLSIGFMLSFLKPGKAEIAVVLSGVVALSCLQTVQLDVAYVLLFDMWSKSLKHTLSAPISPRHYLLGSWLVGIMRSSLTMFILWISIKFLFGFNIFAPGFGTMFVFWSGLMVSGLLIGMLTTIALYTFGMRAEIVPWSIVSVLLLVCGIYYPVAILPPFFRAIGNAIPVTYFLDYYRAAFGLPGGENSAVKGFAIAAVHFVVTYILLKYAARRAAQRGMIMKMSE